LVYGIAYTLLTLLFNKIRVGSLPNRISATYVGTLYGYFDEYVDKAYFGLYTSLLFSIK
jgi:hypothetical protein